jgi:ComF family protein
MACVLYDDNTKKLVHNFKFSKKTYLAYHMAEIMGDKLLKSNLEIDYMIPVPIHKNKKRKRGFNQSELLCKYISKRTNIKTDYKTLIKYNETLEQNKLNKMERQKNLKNAFRVVHNENMVNKNILLVDDVFTTGSTIDACCDSLNKLKPKNIYSITFSIGKNT